MGAQLSKGGVAVEGKAASNLAAAKANGQENGHVKTNGDVADKPDGEVDAADGADIIELAPAAESKAVKVEGETAKDGKKKKKKKFSLKNSFKGISLKKGKRGSKEGKEGARTEDKPEENCHAAKETKEETQATKVKDGQATAHANAAPEGETKTGPEDAPPTEVGHTEEVSASPAQDTTAAASGGEGKAE
uniref:MARCKS-related protein 1-A n=1 Tax=Semicossyphus pulcher TaxID=241346 RepID=UPI0037E896FF